MYPHPILNIGFLFLIFITCITIHTNSISFVLQGANVKHTLIPIFVLYFTCCKYMFKVKPQYSIPWYSTTLIECQWKLLYTVFKFTTTLNIPSKTAVNKLWRYITVWPYTHLHFSFIKMLNTTLKTGLHYSNKIMQLLHTVTAVSCAFTAIWSIDGTALTRQNHLTWVSVVRGRLITAWATAWPKLQSCANSTVEPC